MGKVYKMSIAGCARELPICPISDTLDIAGFVMFGDVEITEKTAAALLEKCPKRFAARPAACTAISWRCSPS